MQDRKAEALIKEQRILACLEENHWDAAVIGRADNFAWLTCGGENRVILSSEAGFSYIVLTKSEKFMVALVADLCKVMDEEAADLGYTPVVTKWFEGGAEAKVLELVRGMRVVSDIPIAGADYSPDLFYKLHYPLTRYEIERYREAAVLSEQIIAETAACLHPGMREYDVQGMLWEKYGRHNVSVSVMIIGSDERIAAYRHCCPTGKRIEKTVLISPAVKKWGLHSNLARMVCFGAVPAELAKRYDAVCRIEAAAIAMSKPGIRFADILSEQKRLYKELGYENEWHKHFQGGITGYMVSDPTLCMDASKVVTENQAFDWFITISGAKGEELTLNTGGEIEVPSVSGIWPCETYRANGMDVKLPKIMVL